ncbi:TlpA family protein disulfide reductase [Winogradskyella aurantiaca]|uniref:TlpA family protein disulfide reductase n=1 Tax=Winogradskyella aurantiaca TaxID=2219558 RepID=UPI000E1E131F|nr:TlpA disulfide reductase family protein [Winogradskyella aurantiaca]
MKFLFRSLLATILLSFFYSCQKTEERLAVFDPTGKSLLNLNNQSKDTLKLNIRNELNLTMSEQLIDTLVAPGKAIQLSLTTESRDYYSVTINNRPYRLFAEPNTLNELSVSEDSKVNFSGDFKVINKFLTTRSTVSDWNPWNKGLRDEISIEELMASNDSVLSSQQQQLANYKGLPKWYTEFEHLRLEYIKSGANLSALSYRVKALSSTDPVPDNFLNTTIKDLPIQNTKFNGVIAYMNFLQSYLDFKIDPRIENSLSGAGKDEWTNYVENTIKASKESLGDSKIGDVHLARYFSFIFNYLDLVWNDEWLAHLKDPEISNYVKTQIQAKPLLAPGEYLPYFSLPDMNSKEYQPEDFKGKVLLINFWGTWCSPCIKEFPYEDALVEQFKDEPVAIVNICQDSDEDLWRKMVNKYDLKTINLYANDDWTKTLVKAFGSQGLPHSVLVDAQGKVIKNKCARASAGVDALIEDALKKMKEKDVQ